MVRFAVFYTGASMNTARAFGPAVVTGFSFPGHSQHWVVRFVTARPYVVISPTFVRFSVLGWSVSGLFAWSSLLYITEVVSHGFSIDHISCINYLELNPAQASTRVEDSPGTPTIFATERVTDDTEASASVVPPSAPNGQGKSNAE
ncbi:hypothetical protein J3R82DRAFT_11310 [Butyriboletus roseoflavus]|nr:hypothetical protein J3R82DRAFT_11310 [Butyriboletus roseoflavus]